MKTPAANNLPTATRVTALELLVGDAAAALLEVAFVGPVALLAVLAAASGVIGVALC